MVNKTNPNTTNIFAFLHVTNYVLLFLFYASKFGVRYFFTTNRRKIFRTLQTMYVLCIGILLATLQYGIFIDLKKRTCVDDIMPFLTSAGFMILATLTKDELGEVWDLIVPESRIPALEKFKTKNMKIKQ